MNTRRRSLVIHPTPCTGSTTLASARIAAYLAKRLECHLVDSQKSAMRARTLSFDVVCLVAGPMLYCDFRDAVEEIVERATTVVYVQNDYKLQPPSYLKARDYLVWTSVEGGAGIFVNWNLMGYDPLLVRRPLEYADRIGGLLYYGAYRDGRAMYFRRYLAAGVPYDVHVSTAQRAARKFKHLNPDAHVYRAFSTMACLARFATTVYIEDLFSHRVYCCPACRFYECLSAGVAMVFDVSTIGTFRRAGYDISDYVVDGPDDVTRLMPHSESIARKQRTDWVRDYRRELDERVTSLIATL